MRLRVSREEPRASDILELASRKCLVGSSPSCDLRVDEPGVAPIACLILHGAKNNVVRWLDASQEFAGGELFQDEILCAGDPLQIGPVELELLVDEIMAAEQPPTVDEMPVTSEARLAEYISRLERLEIQLVELQHASEATATLSSAAVSNSIAANQEVTDTISGLAAQLADMQTRGAADRDLWASEKAELEASLQSRLLDFDRLQQEVERLRDELAVVRSEYSSLAANHDTDERLAELSQQLAERTEEFEQEQANREHERSEFQRQLQQHIERLERFETQLTEQSTRQAESEAARRAAEERADRLQDSVEELSRRLAQQQEEFDAVRAAWEADRAALESELAETKLQLAEAAAAEASELSRRETCEPSNETAQSPMNRGVSSVRDNPMDRLLNGNSLPNAYSDDIDEPIRDFSSTIPLNHAAVDAAYPDDCYSDGEFGHADVDAQHHYERAFSGFQTAAYLADEAEPVNEEPEEVVFQPATSAPPVSTADVLARMGRSGLCNDDEADTDDVSNTPPVDHSDAPNDVFSRFKKSANDEPRFDEPQFKPVNASPFTSPLAGAASNSDDEEESIEAYMARLMNRVRGSDERDEPRRRVAPTVDRSPVTEYTEVAKVSRPQEKPDLEPEREKLNLDEYKPRTRAPEAADRLTAMRNLANDSARTAIASHAKRNWSSVMQLKLLVSVFAFICVVVSVIFFWGDFLLMTVGSLLGVGVFAYWIRNAITYRKLLLDSLMLEPEGGHGEDSTREEDLEG